EVETAKGRVEQMHAVVDTQDREIVLAAPQAQRFGLADRTTGIAIVSDQQDAVQIGQQVVPGIVERGVQSDRNRVGRLEAGRVARWPQPAAVPLVFGSVVLPADANAKGGRLARHGGLLSSVEASSETPHDSISMR